MVIGNDGIGPALLKKVTISTKNDQHFNRTDDFFRHLSKVNTFSDTTHYLYSTVAEGILIPANPTTEFALFDNSPDFKRFLTLLYEVGFHFEIEYEEVYGAR